ncbi:hypothetical protein WDW37_17355 [Bdellovibrionota bacterium FG-1]
MRAVDKAEFSSYLSKGHQHQKVANWSHKEKDSDAAVTNFCIALINYLDALSVNRFGKDLSSDGHEGAPTILHKQLNGIGITDFKSLARDCINVLKLKNVASYRSKALSVTDSKFAKKTVEEAKAYVESKLDAQIAPI